MDTARIVTLSQRPDWLYLMRDLYDFYRWLPGGGSKAIAAHQREVRERISRAIQRDVPIHARSPATKPVVAHLPRALARGRLEIRHAPFIDALAQVQGEL